MIEIKDIAKTFGEKQVLKGISGTFKPSDTSLIIGGSGTGKSVLLKCMIGLVKPDQGQVLYNGRDFYHNNDQVRREIRRETGVLFQGSALFDSKTVEQNVMFPLNVLTQMSLEEKRERVNFCLTRVGLENINNRMPSEISGGMQKRVGIARAIVMNPKYLFCDEPNSGLDPLTAIRIDELIKNITDEYCITTIVVTHDMNSVMGIGERIMFLYQGDKLWEGSNETIFNTTVPHLKEFIFASQLMRDAKENEEREEKMNGK
jgi:phospholipid/cholesterol/gamma-HCH transport system ATP-binding protein